MLNPNKVKAPARVTVTSRDPMPGLLGGDRIDGFAKIFSSLFQIGFQ